MKYSFIITIICLCLFSCKGKEPSTQKLVSIDPCNDCPISKNEGDSYETDSSTTNESWAVNGNFELETKVNKIVDAKLKADGKYDYQNFNVKYIKEEISRTNPDLTQKTNTLRGVACALCKSACSNPTLTPEEKNRYCTEYIKQYGSYINQLVGVKSNLDNKPLIPNKERVKQEKNYNLSPLSITMVDSDTNEPIKNVSVVLDGYDKELTTNNKGIFIIPSNVRSKYGEYNSIKVRFRKEGYKSSELNIGLSENHSYQLKKM